jgi:predicted ribosomally synthesized peptide with nif11-like leader
MSKMKELYEKVAADSTLQDKFAAIMGGAEEAGKEATEEKLTAFARDAGYDVTLDEMRQFFKELEEAELSEADLDMVAGGKEKSIKYSANCSIDCTHTNGSRPLMLY